MEIEVPSFDPAAAVFQAWAGDRSGLRLVWGPDPILAVDQPGRRGYLIDDIYLAVAWICEGGEELMRAMQAEGIRTVLLPTRNDNGTNQALFEMVMKKGIGLSAEP